MKYYLIAGERSGDLHASNLMRKLMEHDKKAEFRYFGGDYMKAVGDELIVHYREMAFMGFLEVLRNLTTIKKYIKTCKEDIQSYQPDAIILVDYAGFNLRIAKFAKAAGFKVFYYISPKIWAWNQKRALKIKKSVDYVFAILPFEVDFYQKFDYSNVEYVGNPVVESVAKHKVDQQFLTNYGIQSGDKAKVAVLPGSRKQELKYILPTLISVIKENTTSQFLVAGVKSLPEESYAELTRLENVQLIFDDTYNLLAHSDAAIVTSGTATLETALWGVPQVVVYKGSGLSIAIAKMVVKVKYISLVNLILDQPCVTELIQEDCTPETVTKELKRILANPNDYTELRQTIGNSVASEKTAVSIIRLLS